MACRLFDAKAITWTDAGWLSIGPLGNSLSENFRNSIIYIQENAIEHVFCPNGGHFVKGKLS